jgi:hypothetical protein
MREMSVAEQRYQAVLAVIKDGRTVTEVAGRWSVQALVLDLSRAHPYWGAQRIALYLSRKKVVPAPSESAVYRCLVRAGVIDPLRRRRRREHWKRWERGRPMELWQMDVVGGSCSRTAPA